MRVLVSRTDRLGDCLLATPVLRELLEAKPDLWITFLVHPAWVPLLRYREFAGELGKRIEILPFDKDQPEALKNEIQKRMFDTAVVLRDERIVTQIVNQLRIAVRVGPLSSFRSFFCFNKGVYQKRSKCEKHEAAYNLDLLKPLGVEIDPTKKIRSWIAFDQVQTEEEFESWKQESKCPNDFSVFHMGSRGSSRYLTPIKTLELIETKAKDSALVLTAGPGEAEALKLFIQEKINPSHLKNIFTWGVDKPQTLPGLAVLFQHSKEVIAHGTGPLHLAAAVNAKVVAIFPPLFVLSGKRWGPLCDQAKVWTPNVECPEKYKCRLSRCKHYDCMDLFQPKDI